MSFRHSKIRFGLCLFAAVAVVQVFLNADKSRGLPPPSTSPIPRFPIPVVANPVFLADPVLVSSNSVTLRATWPETLTLPENSLDVFAAPDLSSPWYLAGTLDNIPSSTNSYAETKRLNTAARIRYPTHTMISTPSQT